MGRMKNRVMAALITRFPRLFDLEKYAGGRELLNVEGIPWTPFTKRLSDARVALVTTAGVHLPSQKPFDMADSDGDPTYRALPLETPEGGYTITHDYYDHSDAGRDINVVFPIFRLCELAREGFIREAAPVNYGFMGHIEGEHIETLIRKTAPEVAGMLKKDAVDAVLLTPG
ncbi:MAG: glycine/sarcosine/betaine reductase selenoprotein B family protein [Thermodesulfobacteriota bacterium]